MNYYIYIITNLINNKKYIGKRSTRFSIEQDKYMGSGKILLQAYQKYGKENFIKEIIEICSDEKELNKREKYWIDYYNACNNENFYNIAEGGTGGNTYKGLSKEELERIKQIKSQQTKGENNPNYGKHFTEEQKIKMSNSLKESYIKNKDHWGTTGLLGDKNPLSKKIYCPELDNIYIGIREASRKLNIPSPNIIRALKSNGKFSAGKGPNKEKLHWFYMEEI